MARRIETFDTDKKGRSIYNLGGVGIGSTAAPIVRTATVVVAASDASAKSKAQADYVCDGTDDQVEIQAAIDSLPDGGGTIYLTEGHFNIGSTITFSGETKFVGAGPMATKLTLVADCNMFEFNGGTSAEYFSSFENLWLYGDNSNRTSGWAIYVPIVEGVSLVDSRIVDCYIDSFEDGGVYIENSWGWIIDRSAIEHHHGYALRATGGDLIIANSKISGNRNFNDIAAAYLSVKRTLITNCQFQSNGTRGLELISADGSVVSNCSFRGNSEDSSGTEAGFVIYNSNNVIITNCQFDGYNDVKHVNTEKYGLYIYSNCSNIKISNSHFMNHTTQAIYDPGNVLIDSNQFVDHFQDLQAASTTYVHTAITGTGAEQEVTTGITSPDVPRNASITTTNNASPSGDVTIEGIDAKGNSITENITIVAGGTAYGDKAFAKVTKIIIPAGVSASDTVSVGISDKLGLSNVIYATGDVYKVKRNNADDTIGTVDVTNGTVDCAPINDGDDITIYYRSNLNIID